MYAGRWRGSKTLQWRSVTDWRVGSAGTTLRRDQFALEAGKAGYRNGSIPLCDADQRAGDSLESENVLRFRGTVKDAETGRPIETFVVVPGTQIGGPPPLWMFDFAKTHHEGRYTFSFKPNKNQPHLVRIESKGYLPAVSPAQPNNAGEQVFDATLVRGAWLEGLVRGRDGAPLSRSEVIVVTGRGIHISGGKTFTANALFAAFDGPRRPVFVLAATVAISADCAP